MKLAPISFPALLSGALLLAAATPALAGTLTWTGAGDGTTFGQPQNWSPATAPTTTSDCVIPAGPTDIAIVQNANVRSLSTARNINLDSCMTIVLRAGLTLSSGAVVTVNNSGGCVALLFQGGTQSIAGSGKIVVSSLGNNGTIVSLNNHASVDIGSGIALEYDSNSGGQNTTVTVASGCSLTNFGTITHGKAGAQFSIEGDGTFTNRGILNVQAGTLVVLHLQDESGQVNISPNAVASLSGDSFTLSSPLSIPAGADVSIDGSFVIAAPIDVTDAHARLQGVWTNASHISSLRSTTQLTGQWTNPGTLDIAESDFMVGGFSPDLGVHQFADVRLTYTEQLPDGAVFTADSSTGDITLDSVLLNQGELRTLDGARFLFNSSPYHWQPSTLTACRLNGEFSIDGCSLVRVNDGLTLLNGSRIALRNECDNGLSFEGAPQSLSGSGELLAIGPDAVGGGPYYMLTVRSEFTMESGITFTVPPTPAAIGTRKIVIETGRLINKGLIRMQAPGGDFAIVGPRFGNQGTIESDAGQVRIYPWNFDNLKNNQLSGGIWRANNAPISFDDATINGIGPGTDLTLNGPLGSIPQLETISSNAGILRLSTRAQSIKPSSGIFTNSGTLDLASDSSFSITGAAAFTLGSTLRTQVSGLNPNQIGRFTATGSTSLAGKLQGSFAPAYSPVNGDITAPMLQCPQITGEFVSYCFDSDPFDLGVLPLFQAGPPNRLSLEISESAGIPPILLHAPINTSATPNAAFSVDAFPANLVYQWKRDNEILADGPTGTGSVISGAFTSALTIIRAQASDVGQYTVTTSTPCASATSDPVWLRVCNGDFNSDLVVDDSDFLLFVANYNILDCADPAMPQACPGDFNFDGVVDDADFVTFVGAYDTLVCPALSVCSCSAPTPPGSPCLIIKCK